MSYFASVLARTGDRWRGVEVALDDCESITDVVDVALDVPGELRLVLIEQDDEYAVIVRLDDDDEDPRAFLSDGHSADNYPMAALIAEDLSEIGAAGTDAAEIAVGEVGVDEDLLSVAPPGHDSAPFGDAEIVEDLGTSAADLLGMCAHEGTLPIDVLVLVCEKAGCGAVFDELRA